MAYILVVDDDPDTLSMARETLRDAGHRPILAKNVFRALEVLDYQEPDLVLTALEFPDLDGYGLTRAIRKYHPTLPVIAIVSSTNGSRSSTDTGLPPSIPYFDAVIRKPLELTEFSDMVNAIFDQS